MSDRIARIQEKLVRLNRLDQRKGVLEKFAEQKYRGKGIPLSEIEEFEAVHQVKLPDEFREFLLYIGPGSGPEHGIYLLKQMVAEHAGWAEALGEGSLSTPFDFVDEDAEELISLKRENPRKLNYRSLRSANGLLPIGTEGCTYYNCLVITGEQRGKIWSVNNGDGFDIIPAAIHLYKEVTFADWYEDWLDECLSKFPLTLTNKPAEKRNWWHRFLDMVKE